MKLLRHRRATPLAPLEPERVIGFTTAIPRNGSRIAGGLRPRYLMPLTHCLISCEGWTALNGAMAKLPTLLVAAAVAALTFSVDPAYADATGKPHVISGDELEIAGQRRSSPGKCGFKFGISL